MSAVLGEAVGALYFVPHICILHLWCSAEELVIYQSLEKSGEPYQNDAVLLLNGSSQTII